jgi:ethanolamine kinase
LLAANILFHTDTDCIQLIDFEYGGFNYAAFDIANHWNEYAGGTEPGTLPNYDWLPTMEQQRSFLKAYLTQVHASEQKMQRQRERGTIVDSNAEAQNGEDMANEESSQPQQPRETDEDETTADDVGVDIDAWLWHVHLFQMANHMYWGLWAVNQAAAEGCEGFDYLLYASKRLERYQFCKNEWTTEES